MVGIIALWGAPRTVSTAFEKAFAQRTDTTTFHEPFNDCYYFSAERRSDRYGDHPPALGYDGRAAQNMLSGNGSPVTFFKDLAFLALPYVEKEFLANIKNTFIIRDPHRTMRSLKRLKPTFSEYEYGFVPLMRMWEMVTKELGQEPIVVDGEMLREKPEEVLRSYCEAVGVQFDAAMLRWDKGKLREWQNHEEGPHRQWHRTLDKSTGFMSSEDPAAHHTEEGLSSDEERMVQRARGIYDALRPYAIG